MARRDIFVAAGIGIALALGSLAYLLASAHRGSLLIVLGVEVAAGREASIPAGIARGLSWQETALVVSLIELTSIFLLFPILVGLATGLHKVRWLEGSLVRAQAYAKRNPKVDVLALGALTFMPLLPIGALTSILVGELLRIPSRYLLPVIAGALVIANVVTAFVAVRLLSLFPDPRLAAGIMTGVVLAAAGIAWLVHRRRAAAPPA